MSQWLPRRAATLMLLSTGFAGTLSAQVAGGHTHAAPHGGEVVETAEHHVEFKADSSGAISVWLLDENEKVTTPPAGGRVTLIPEGGDQITLPLNIDAAAQRLVARFDPKKLSVFQAVVSLTIGGSRHNFRFHYPPSHH